jgi:hypothetical protein
LQLIVALSNMSAHIIFALTIPSTVPDRKDVYVCVCVRACVVSLTALPNILMSRPTEELVSARAHFLQLGYRTRHE